MRARVCECVCTSVLRTQARLRPSRLRARGDLSTAVDPASYHSARQADSAPLPQCPDDVQGCFTDVSHRGGWHAGPPASALGGTHVLMNSTSSGIEEALYPWALSPEIGFSSAGRDWLLVICIFPVAGVC